MHSGRWDERCPHCERREVIAVYDFFVAHDYATEFKFDCPFCDETIEVQVHAVPEFELFKPEVKDEETQNSGRSDS